MGRRTLFAALSPIAGCGAPGEDTATNDSTPPTATATPQEQPTTAVTSTRQDTPTPTVTPPPDDPILFVVDNDTDSEQTVTLTIARNETAVLDETETLAAGELVEYDSMISATGEYTITVEVASGPSQTIDRPIGRFAIRNGSNHFVDITADEIRIYWEE